VTSRLTWAVAGCRLTGKYIIILGRKYESCEDVGAFGAIVDHRGAAPVTRWYTSLEGPGLSGVKGAKDTYQLLVQTDSVAPVTARFESKEARWAAFFDSGGGFPQGTFKSAFNNGFSLNAGLEYSINSFFSAEGIFGYHHFTAKIGSNQNIYQFSGNAKFYLTPPPKKVRLFVNLGPGGYAFSPGSTHFGGNVGAGLQFKLSSRLGLQGSYNFHAVNTAGGATEFSTAQLGLRLVF